MTQTIQTQRQIFTGDGTDTDLNLNMPLFDNEDLLITEVIIATEVETVLVLGVDYTVAVTPGISAIITPLAAIPGTINWVVTRVIPNTQDTDLISQTTFPAEAIETRLDKLTLQHIDIREELSRCVKIAIGSENYTRGIDIPKLLDRTGKTLQWDANGDITAVVIDTSGVLSASVYGESIMIAADRDANRTILDQYVSTLATRPADPAEGAIHFATDTFAWSYYDGADWQAAVAAVEAISENLIVNGGANVNQRVGPYDSAATYPNEDGEYCLDQMVILSEADGDVDVTQETTDVPVGFQSAVKMVVQGGSNKFGIFMPLTTAQSARILGTTEKACISVYAKGSANIDLIRMTLLNWTDAPDNILRDPVNVWNAGGADLTLTGSWTLESPETNKIITTSWARYSFTDIDVDAVNGANVGLMVWYNRKDAIAADELFLTGFQINPGSELAPYIHETFAAELQECQQFFTKSFDYSQEPGENKGNLGAVVYRQDTHSASRGESIDVRFPVAMFKTPTITFGSIGEATTEFWNIQLAQAVIGGAAAQAENIGTQGFSCRDPKSAKDVAHQPCGIQFWAEAVL